MIFPLELLLDLLRAGSIRTHKSQKPLLQVARGGKTSKNRNSCCLILLNCKIKLITHKMNVKVNLPLTNGTIYLNSSCL